jgi:FkbM family methyltransferase
VALKRVMRQCLKAGRVVVGGSYLSMRALRYGVAEAIEHKAFIRAIGDLSTVVDIGANRGQFALAVHAASPSSRIFAFEPLPRPAAIFRRIFAGLTNVILFESAIGPNRANAILHVSAKDDSSSLLPIGETQVSQFPGTYEERQTEVKVGRLAEFVTPSDIAGPALLKLDVQGYELQALEGCEELLRNFEYIYAECSFVELYEGQALAHEVIAWLARRGFRFAGSVTMTYAANMPLQGDLLFRKSQ